MTTPEVWTFFYGSFINLDVLAALDYRPRRHAVARLPGYDLTIAPLANLLRADNATAYGIVATGTHADLARLYEHAEHELGGRYLPEAVLVQLDTGEWLPALCYIAPRLSGAPATGDYVARIAGPARALGFPAWYLDKIESFAP